jgi:hypothetical protein
VLCLYVLPSFAAILKIRAKKLAQIDAGSNLMSISTTLKTNQGLNDYITEISSRPITSVFCEIDGVYSNICCSLTLKDIFFWSNFKILTSLSKLC